MVFRPFQELLPRHVGITIMIDEEVILERHGDFVSGQFFSSIMFSYLSCAIQLIHAIVVVNGAEDLNLLQKKLKQMGILDNSGLPESVLELLVKLESSAVDSVEEVEV